VRKAQPNEHALYQLEYEGGQVVMRMNAMRILDFCWGIRDDSCLFSSGREYGGERRTQMRAQILMKWGSAAGLIAMVLFWVTLSTGLTEEEPAITAGKLEFGRNCAICHGINGKGSGPITPLLKKTPADLTQLSKKNSGKFPFWPTYRMIDGREPIDGHGGRDMPIWGDRFRAEAGSLQQGAEATVRGRILEIIVYLQSIQEE